MPEPALIDPFAPDAPLGDLAVLEIEGEFSPYVGRLLADLGADVVRVRFTDPEADPGWWAMHRNKSTLLVDLGRDEDHARLAGAIDASDIVVQSGGADARSVAELDPIALRAEHPRAIHAILSPFGLGGPMGGYASTDLVRLAAGGLLWLGGYPDAEPIAPYGEQSTLCTAIYGVVAILLATIERERTGVGQTIDISAQEVLTQALETSLPEYELTGNVRKRTGSTPREAGTGVYRCADGFVSMVAGRLGTAEAWRRLREWLVESEVPGAEELWDEDWETLAFRQRPESVARFSSIFAEFARSRPKGALYVEAQRRSIALAPVNTPAEVLADPQLEARQFFRQVTDDATGARAMVPSSPYRFLTAHDRAASR